MLFWILLTLIISQTTSQIDKYGEKQEIFGITDLLNITVNGAKFILSDSTDFKKKNLNDITPIFGDKYDFIVVGAGSAGATIAARLSELPNTTVLLIEAGGKEKLIYDVPIFALYLQLLKNINWGFKLEPSNNYCRGMKGNQCNFPQGKVTGGGSVLNFMIATRGNKRDYNKWAAAGNKGWSYKDVLKYFKKLENFMVKEDPVATKYHSTKGPVNIEEAPYRTPLALAFIEGVEEMDYDIIDYDGSEQIGFAYHHATLKNGERWSTNRAYLQSSKNRTNLFLTIKSHVNRILIDPNSNKAYGVSFTKNRNEIEVYAKKEVIICAGAINSPKLLMLSGVGPSKHLRKLEINVIKNLNGVGENLMDHITYWNLNFLVNQSASLLVRRNAWPSNPSITDYLKTRDGPGSITGGVEAIGFINTEDLNATSGRPNLEILFISASLGSDLFYPSILGISSEHYKATLQNMLQKEAFMLAPTLIAPKSRGWIHLQSKNPKKPPKIYTNYFDHPDDVKTLIKGIQISIELSKSNALQKYNAHLPDNPIIGCEKFEKYSDDYWDCAIRTFSSTLYHPTGTCKMGPRNDTMAVVDSRLRVHGIKRLRIGDGSIMPEIIRGHPNIPIIMIGEKLADMVKEDWNYNKV